MCRTRKENEAHGALTQRDMCNDGFDNRNELRFAFSSVGNYFAKGLLRFFPKVFFHLEMEIAILLQLLLPTLLQMKTAFIGVVWISRCVQHRIGTILSATSYQENANDNNCPNLVSHS